MTNTQTQTAQAIVRVFETGSVRGDYGGVTVIPGDTGHLSFGVFQATLGSGNLHLLVKNYCANPGARFATALAAYLGDLERRDATLDANARCKNLLRASADDLVMRDTQDAFFADNYWAPAMKIAAKLQLTTPLGMSIVFDGRIQGSFERIQRLVSTSVGAPRDVGEQRWLGEYVRTRREWLAGSARADLRATVYRMDVFTQLMDSDHWTLALPIVVRAVEISEQTLAALPANCFTGPPPGSRSLFVDSPLMRGLDVRLAQLALSERGYELIADGIFGRSSQKIVAQFQGACGLPATGTIDASLFKTLGVLGGTP